MHGRWQILLMHRVKTLVNIFHSQQLGQLLRVYEELADWLNTVFSRAQAGVFIADTWQHAHNYYEKTDKDAYKAMVYLVQGGSACSSFVVMITVCTLCCSIR